MHTPLGSLGQKGEVAPAYRRDIDGLRAIAVTSVVLYHANIGLFGGGFVGVDIFFVISGFLIGSIIFRSIRDARFSFATFYARRARRILPALSAVFLFVIAVGFACLSPSEYKAAATSAGASLVGVSNILFWRKIDYFNPTAEFDPMLMTWSLGVEEQFYVGLPLLMILLVRFSARVNLWVIAVITLASFALSVGLSYSAPNAAFYLLPTRAWELGIGVVLAIWRVAGLPLPHRRAADVVGTAGLAAIVASITLFDPAVLWPGFLATVPTAGTAAVIATEQSVVSRRLLSLPPFVGIGLISYSWYLWHWPLLAFLRIGALGEPSGAAIAAAVIASLALGALSWRFIEQPFRHAGASSRTTLTRYGASVAALVAIAIGIAGLRGLPQRVGPAVVAADRAIAQTHNYPCLKGVVASPHFSSGCVAVRRGQPALAIMGDSHAAALAPGVQALAARAGLGHAVLTKSSCRPLLGVTVEKADDPVYANRCAAFVRQSVGWLADHPEVRTVVLAGLWTGPITNAKERYTSTAGREGSEAELLRQGLADMIRQLRAQGKQVMVAEDTPYLTFDPDRAAMAAAMPGRSLLSGLATSTPSPVQGEMGSMRLPRIEERQVRAATEEAGGRYLPLRKTLCQGERCRYRQGAALLFADRSHLTPAGAAAVLAPLEAELLPPTRR